MNLADLNDIFSGRASEIVKGIITPKKKFSVFVSTVCYSGFKGKCVNSLLKLLLTKEPKMLFKYREGDALIDRARSHEASQFLQRTDCDVFLSLDYDINYEPEQIINMVKACHEGYDIVGGAYVLKKENKTALAVKSRNDETVYLGDRSDLQEVAFVSTGCMAVHRNVFERMKDTLPFCHPQTMKFWPFFQPMPIEHEGQTIYASEDWAFCHRAKELGFKVWVDGRVKLTHFGEYGYDWNDFKRPDKENFENIAVNVKTVSA